MKKTISLLTTFCLILMSYVGVADCDVWTDSARCSSYSDDSNSQSFYFTATNGLSVNAYAYAPNEGTAYAYVSWPSAGSVSYWDYYPSAVHSNNYFDYYALSGTISMGASATGSGSHAGSAVYW